MYLPNMVTDDGIRKVTTENFGGYNHTLAAKNGMIWDEENIVSDFFPLLSPRGKRYLQNTLTKPNGFYCNDGMFWVDGTKFYADGVEKGTVEDSGKTFASLGRYIVILPDKAYYDTVTGTFGSMESSTPSGFTATFTDGTYAEEPAEANTIKASSGFDWSDYFRPGDAVTISGASNPQNNTTIIVREISGNELRFYPNSFHVETTAEAITVKRSIPDMDFICENENRLWGCKGDSIFSTKLGDIFNWNVFDGVATDSYAVDVGSVGDFTGCCSYLGYPIFFKEEHIYKVYGDKPSNYQVMGSASLGTAVGAGRSIAIAGETLFYLARTGIVAYNGGIPSNISSAFGTDKYTDAVGGSDGVKYYVSMKDESGHWSIFTNDTRYGVWHREDEKQVIDFGWNQNLYFLDSSGKLWMNWDARNPTGTAESAISSMVEFADFTEPVGNSPRYGANKKGVSKVQMRVELDANATLKVQIKFDSSDTWIDIKTMTTTRKRSFYLPIIPRRGDHFRIKLTGTGDWKLYALTRESYSGSEL